MDSRKNFLLRWRREIQRLISQSLASLGTSCITTGLTNWPLYSGSMLLFFQID